MNDDLAQVYEGMIVTLMGHQPGLVSLELYKLTKVELGEVHDRAVLELEAREELREMVAVRLMNLGEKE